MGVDDDVRGAVALSYVDRCLLISAADGESVCVSPRTADLKNFRQQSGVFHELERIYGRMAALSTSPSPPNSRTQSHKQRGRHT